MALPRTNLAIRAGDEKTWTVTIKDDAGSTVNIAGATLSWKIAEGKDATADITKTNGSGIAITDGPNGVLTLTLDEADTASLVGDYYHEIQAVDGSGVTQTMLRGTLRIERTLH